MGFSAKKGRAGATNSQPAKTTHSTFNAKRASPQGIGETLESAFPGLHCAKNKPVPGREKRHEVWHLLRAAIAAAPWEAGDELRLYQGRADAPSETATARLVMRGSGASFSGGIFASRHRRNPLSPHASQRHQKNPGARPGFSSSHQSSRGVAERSRCSICRNRPCEFGMGEEA